MGVAEDTLWPAGRARVLQAVEGDGVSREVPCSALKGETVPDSLPATPKSPPYTPGSPEGNTEGPGTSSSEPLLPS